SSNAADGMSRRSRACAGKTRLGPDRQPLRVAVVTSAGLRWQSAVARPTSTGPEPGKADVDRIEIEFLRVEGVRPVEKLGPPGVVRSLQRRQEIGVAPDSAAVFRRARTLPAEAYRVAGLWFPREHLLDPRLVRPAVAHVVEVGEGRAGAGRDIGQPDCTGVLCPVGNQDRP